MVSISPEKCESVVADKYKICKKIGSGTYGICYEGEDVTTGQKVAIKVQNIKKKSNSLLSEIRIYRRYLKQETSGIPVLHWYGTDTNIQGQIMVMDLLGPNLDKMLKFCSNKFSLKTVLMIAIQILERLQSLHNNFLIHRDIKPENFLLGTGSQSNQIYIIDFGLSKSYIDRRTRSHIEFVPDIGITGTPRYCSVNANRGHEQSRRDDLESVAYMLSYFSVGSLPWQGLKPKYCSKNRVILQVKESLTADQLFPGMAPVFSEFLTYCKKLEFRESPDYGLWINRFRQLFDESDYVWDYKYDWISFYEKLDLN